MLTVKRAFATLSATAMLVVGVAGPATAQPEQNGLVNVNVSNNQILNQNNVGIGVAANVAAQLCGIGVNVLAANVARTGQAACDAGQNGTVTLTQVTG